ncbi:hypothetical protein F3Y22_tig00110267pilonHSYRG00046 [Hibiscus syriacus]|uniref:C2 domain-containing protein n=1 Tax=Hibiscus syriacus TaxID=106335 RepID=A0A6A3B9T7_HIBSY|nr:hypothetical protein F3Y22_tig00110267pilonHSYRG00046 [Hibiscus syriacus]
MKFLFVRIVRARDLPLETPNGIMNIYVEIKIGNYRATTKYFEKKPDSEWNQAFAFAVYLLQGTTMEINVINEDVIGKITIALHDVPTCLPPDSPLAHNAASKVYRSPKLWYLRVNVIQAQDLVPGHKGRNPEVYAKSVVGEDRLENNTIRHLGKCIILLSDVDQRLLPLTADPKWYNLEGVVLKMFGAIPAYSESAMDDYDRSFGVGDHKCYGLQPMKVREGRETTDAYCVAKYGLSG